MDTTLAPRPQRRSLGSVLHRRSRDREPAPAGRPPEGVRPRRSRDLATCTRLMHRAFFEGQFKGTRRDEPREWIDGPDVLAAYVADRDGEIVGHVAVTLVGGDTATDLRWREVTGHPVTDLAGVGQLFVRPSFRGGGIGRSLVDAALADIGSRGLVPVLEVITDARLAPAYAHGHGWRLRATDRFPGPPAGLWVHRMEAALPS
jgi:GNAT superfamily N-acetyltransferase